MMMMKKIKKKKKEKWIMYRMINNKLINEHIDEVKKKH
jgi:hypothetical protein